MQCVRILRTGLAINFALTGFSLPSAADPADDELEATMDVLDDLSDVGDNVRESPEADAGSESARPEPKPLGIFLIFDLPPRWLQRLHPEKLRCRAAPEHRLALRLRGFGHLRGV
jgi:hypothetical protein